MSQTTTIPKTRKPKWIISYGRGGIQNCYTRKDIGDFLAYFAEHGGTNQEHTVTIRTNRKAR